MDAIFGRNLRQINWSTLVMFVLGFWLSASLIIDSVIIPSLSVSGMMTQDGFAIAGYLLFGIFNKIELLAAAIVLSGFLIFSRNHNLTLVQERWAIFLASVLFIIALAYTYILTPQLSGLGLHLNLFDVNTSMPSAMIPLQGSYWVLEVIKFLSGTILLSWCYRNTCRLV